MGTNDESGDLLSDVTTAPEPSGDTEETAAAADQDTGNLDYKDESKSAESDVVESQPPQDKAFLEQAEEQFRGKLEKFNSWNEVAKGYVNLEGKLAKSLVPPGPDATDEERADFYQKLGAPKTPNGYKLEKPPTMDEKIWNTMKRASHAAHLTENQFRQTILTYAKMTLENAKAVQAERIAARDEAREALKKEWGKDFDRRREVVNRVTGRFMTEGLLKKFSAYEDLALDPDIMKFFYGIGDAMGEKNLVEGNVRPKATDVQGRLTYK